MAKPAVTVPSELHSEVEFSKLASPATVNEAPPEMVLLLDPALIDPGETPNRIADAMDDEAMDDLALSILLSRGNQQPIQVRMLAQPKDGYQYALISGSRRLCACARHNLPVRALVLDVTPQQALVERLIENHLRESLSPWELGQQLAFIKTQAGDELSIRKLAHLIGINLSMVQKALDIAALPAAVVEAFASPKDLRYGDSKVLKDLVAAAPEAVVKAALQLKDQALPVRQVIDQLAKAVQMHGSQDSGVEPFNTPLHMPLKVQGHAVGEFRADKSGQLVIALQTAMSLPQQQALAQCVEQFIARKVLRIQHKKSRNAAVSAPFNTAEAANDKNVKTATTGGFGNEEGAA